MSSGAHDLIGDLGAARDEFFSTLDAIDPRHLNAAGLIGEWGARELVAHLGYWTGHAVEIIHAVESGRRGEAGMNGSSVDEVNATVARVARQTDLARVRTREAASAQALVERLGGIDPALLSERLPGGATLEEGIIVGGSAHYREHLAELRLRGMTDEPH